MVASLPQCIEARSTVVGDDRTRFVDWLQAAIKLLRDSG
jgi:hypothetical protein